MTEDTYIRFISKAWNAITEPSAEHVWGPFKYLTRKRNLARGVGDWLALTLSMGSSLPALFHGDHHMEEHARGGWAHHQLPSQDREGQKTMGKKMPILPGASPHRAQR